MNINREIINTDTLILEDEPTSVGKLQVRSVSLASMLVLKKIASPLYAAMLGGDVTVAPDDLDTIAEFVWVHAAPWADVRRLAARAEYSRDAVTEAVLDFVSTLPPDALLEMFSHVVNQQERSASAAAKALPREGMRDDDSKN